MSFRTNATDILRFALAAGFLAIGPNARAQGAPGTSEETTRDSIAAAQALFVEGRRLVTEGQYAEGCAKLEQSQRLDPAPGTQINLADCFEKSGKLASAWFAFQEASAAAQRRGRAEWAQQARERAHLLEPRVPRLTVVVDEPITGLEVRRGGALLESSALGSPVPVDPGTYEVAAAAPHRRAWSTRVAVSASAQVELHIPELTEEAPPPPAAPIATHPSATFSETLRPTISLGLAALSGVGLGLGSYFGVLAITRNDQAAALCPTSPACTDARAIELTDQSRRAALGADVSFVAGGVLLATAAVLYLTTPRQTRPPSVGISVSARTASVLASW